MAAWLRVTGCTRLDLADCAFDLAALADVPRLVALRIGRGERPLPSLAPLVQATQLWTLTVIGAGPQELAVVSVSHARGR